jgi:hypothetical protein
MAKKIFHPYPHAGAALSPHADAARPYPLSLSLSISLRLSLVGPRGGQRVARGRCGPRRRREGVGHRRAQGGPSSTTTASGVRDPAPPPTKLQRCAGSGAAL